MHDIDRVLFEEEGEVYGEGETYGEEETYETYGEDELLETYGEGETYGENEGEGEGEGETYELAMASELLEIASEDELDQFLGNLVSSAASAARDFARSDTGKALGGILKSAARKALPHIGKALGDYVSPGSGGDFGKRAGKWLGTQFELGLETEGMSAEDREFQAARAFVRFANDAAKWASRAPAALPPPTAARRGAITAARRHLPGLLRRPGGLRAGGPKRRAMSGRWVRRGSNIIIIGG